MQVLEWPVLCSYEARVASTTLGSRAASTLHLPEAQVRPHANPCSEWTAAHSRLRPHWLSDSVCCSYRRTASSL